MIIGMTACIYKYLSLLNRCIPIHSTYTPYPANYKSFMNQWAQQIAKTYLDATGIGICCECS